MMSSGVASRERDCTSEPLCTTEFVSRCTHELPWGQTASEVMQGTADVHHEITDTVPPQPEPVFDDTTALDAAGAMLDLEPMAMQDLVGPLLRPWKRLAAGCLRRQADRHMREREGQEAQSLPPPAPGREGSRGGR